MELWDVYDINRNKLDKVIDRHSKEQLGIGEYHLSVEAFIINKRNEILISKRAEFKNKYPLLWECNGGAVQSGETCKQAIIRELKEELGVVLCDNEMLFYKEIRNDDSKMFKSIWIIQKDIDIDKLDLVDGEVIETKWVTINELENMKRMNMVVPKMIINKEEFESILEIIGGKG